MRDTEASKKGLAAYEKDPRLDSRNNPYNRNVKEYQEWFEGWNTGHYAYKIYVVEVFEIHKRVVELEAIDPAHARAKAFVVHGMGRIGASSEFVRVFDSPELITVTLKGKI